MRTDPPTTLGIAAAAALCSFAAFLAYAPDGAPDRGPQVEGASGDGEALLAAVEAAGVHRASGQDAAAEAREEAFRQRLADVARDRLGVNVSSVEAYNFLSRSQGMAARPGQVCGSAGDIPAHLEELRGAGWFAAFMEKYSPYRIEMHLNDERPKFGFHYGFVAYSGDGFTAGTFFHVDTCTGELFDPDSYQLTCSEAGRSITSSSSYDDTAASLGLEEFCVIPMDSWRQAMCDYEARVAEGGGYPHGVDPEDRESFLDDEWESSRHGMLREVAQMACSDQEDAEILEIMLEYCGRFGPTLPENLEAFLEGSGSGWSLVACSRSPDSLDRESAADAVRAGPES